MSYQNHTFHSHARSTMPMRRPATLRLSPDLSADKIAEHLDRWNTLLGSSFPGVGYFDSLPDLEIENGQLVQKFALHASDAFWEAYQGEAPTLIPDCDSIEIEGGVKGEAA